VRKARPFRVVTPRGGRTLLYIRYRDMRSRAHGRGTGTPWIYPPGWPWESFAEFRAWALESGFTKVNNSPDRIDHDAAYSRANVQWSRPDVNAARHRHAAARYSDLAVRGEEPPPYFAPCNAAHMGDGCGDPECWRLFAEQ
jgi:hypothetical protein